MIYMIVINIFIVPLTGTYFFLKRKNMESLFSMPTVFTYAFFSSWNIPVTRIFTVLAKKIGITVTHESGYYTLLALISSLVVYGLSVVLCEYMNIRLTVEEKDGKQ